jgi:hypothetical protein
VPVIAGNDVLLGGTFAGGGAGAAATGPTEFDFAVEVPPSLDAVTVTVMFCPWSPDESVSVCPVVPSDH